MPLKPLKTLRHLCNRYVPFSYQFTDQKDFRFLNQKINLYFKLFPSKRNTYKNEIEFLNQHASTCESLTQIWPYSFAQAQKTTNVEVFKDASKDLFYVLQNGKKLYYSRHYTTMEAVQNSYCSLVAEQNPDSPHLYLKEGFQVNEGDFVVDLGAAEGNFSLDIVEKAGKIIIVEAENHWIEALNATFEPWQDKVEIIHKYISNINNDRCATLQSLVGNHPIDFLKLDVEGAEGDILNSSSDLLLRKQIRKLAVCTYHRKDDEKQFKLLFNKYDYEIVQTPGYMLFVYGKLTPPFFRKVMIQAVARY